MTVAMGQGARAGILFRNAEAIERMRDIDTVVVDKTGTLTLGRPELLGSDEQAVSGLAFSLGSDAQSRRPRRRRFCACRLGTFARDVVTRRWSRPVL